MEKMEKPSSNSPFMPLPPPRSGQSKLIAIVQLHARCKLESRTEKGLSLTRHESTINTIVTQLPINMARQSMCAAFILTFKVPGRYVRKSSEQ